jgi:hypothetical protein
MQHFSSYSHASMGTAQTVMPPTFPYRPLLVRDLSTQRAEFEKIKSGAERVSERICQLFHLFKEVQATSEGDSSHQLLQEIQREFEAIVEPFERSKEIQKLIDLIQGVEKAENHKMYQRRDSQLPSISTSYRHVAYHRLEAERYKNIATRLNTVFRELPSWLKEALLQKLQISSVRVDLIEINTQDNNMVPTPLVICKALRELSPDVPFDCRYCEAFIHEYQRQIQEGLSQQGASSQSQKNLSLVDDAKALFAKRLLPFDSSRFPRHQKEALLNERFQSLATKLFESGYYDLALQAVERMGPYSGNIFVEMAFVAIEQNKLEIANWVVTRIVAEDLPLVATSKKIEGAILTLHVFIERQLDDYLLFLKIVENLTEHRQSVKLLSLLQALPNYARIQKKSWCGAPEGEVRIKDEALKILNAKAGWS